MIQWEKYVDDEWIRIEIKDVKANDIIRDEEGKRYRAQADAEFWEEDGRWGVMADPI